MLLTWTLSPLISTCGIRECWGVQSSSAFGWIKPKYQIATANVTASAAAERRISRQGAPCKFQTRTRSRRALAYRATTANARIAAGQRDSGTLKNNASAVHRPSRLHESTQITRHRLAPILRVSCTPKVVLQYEPTALGPRSGLAIENTYQVRRRGLCPFACSRASWATDATRPAAFRDTRTGPAQR